MSVAEKHCRLLLIKVWLSKFFLKGTELVKSLLIITDQLLPLLKKNIKYVISSKRKMKLATSGSILIHPKPGLIPFLLLTTFGGRQTFKKTEQYYSHPSHHLNLQNPFLDHSASNDKIVWAYAVAAAVPAQDQPGVRQHSVGPAAGPGPFSLPVTSGSAAYTPALTHTPCSCPQTSLLSCSWPWVLSLLVGTASNSCRCTCSRKDVCKNLQLRPHLLFVIYFSSCVSCFARTYSNNFSSNFTLPHPPMTILQWHLKYWHR